MFVKKPTPPTPTTWPTPPVACANCPLALLPQLYTAPADVRANVCESPAAIATTPVKPEYGFGMQEFGGNPGAEAQPVGDTWPESFAPHVRTAPFATNPTLCSLPAAIAIR